MATEKHYVLDSKVYSPRFGILRRRFNPEISHWKKLKSFVDGESQFDSSVVEKNYRSGSILCPKNVEVATRGKHLALKGLYSFFHIGVVLRQGDSLALFKRQSEGRRITKDQSIVISTSPRSVYDRESILAKIQSSVSLSTRKSQLRPLGIGYNEFTVSRKLAAPSYFWLLFEYRLNSNVSKQVDAKDQLVGLKPVSNLFEKKTRVDQRPVTISGAFDKLVLKALHDGSDYVLGKNCAFRLLSSGERKTVSKSTSEFKTKNASVERELARFARIGLGTSSVVGAIDYARRTEWVAEKAGEFEQYWEMISDIAGTFF